MALAPTDNDKYDVLEIIGRGAFGVIRKVRRKSDGYILCRKEILYTKMSSKERDQLQAEFSILASLKNPHIVGYFHREHIRNNQELHLYMEYCGGGDLGTIIRGLKKKHEYAKEEFVWRVMSQIIVALYRCHYGVDPPQPGDDLSRQKDMRPKKKDQGIMILHRDLKPENVFLGADQSVKLGDFGLSKQIQCNDFAQTYVGTPFYMSPEICAGEKYTHHSDIWSLGCIMYELCTHEPPFNATTHMQLIQRIRKGDFTAIPDFYSEDLANVITSCLKTNPMQRPDVASLLTVPYIWIARKQQEMVGIGKALKTREDIAEQKLKQAEERLSALEADQAAMRIEVEGQLRREWELKARLEIDRQVQMELERLRAKFDREVDEKVTAQLSLNGSSESRVLKELQNPPAARSLHSSSVNTMGDEDFPSITDLTELSQLSIDSPGSSTSKPIPPRKSKTPFTRSKTTFDSPADIQMSEPSPITISSLALSPRRNTAAQATANSTTTSYGAKNIFAEAARQRARWEPALAYALEDEENIDPAVDDSDDDSVPELPSPTRAKATVASTDPFKQPLLPSKNRPVLMRQNTTATMQKLNTRPTLFPTMGQATASAKAEAVKASIAAANASKSDPDLPSKNPTAQATAVPFSRPTSPNRRLSKIPSRNDFTIAVDRDAAPTSPLRRANTTTGLKSKLGNTKHDAPNTTTTSVGGRTLVELAQARAGGRPMSAADLPLVHAGTGTMVRSKTAAPSLAGLLDRDLPPVPVWDPDVEGEGMPSPFLKRDVRSVGVSFRGGLR